MSEKGIANETMYPVSTSRDEDVDDGPLQRTCGQVSASKSSRVARSNMVVIHDFR